MNSFLKKIVAGAMTVTCTVFLVGPGVAQAQSVADLQAQINALLAQLSALQSQLAVLQGGSTATPGACSGITFSRNLSQGMSGSDVKCLQAILNQAADTQVAASGVGSAGNETMYFGPLTRAAVVKFQEKYASEVLTPIGLTAGTGYVGSMTIAKLNTMTGGVVTTPPPVTPGAGENKVSLAADSPAAATIAKGSQDVVFAKINFCAAAAANTVSKIILSRGGVAADSDISNIKLYDGAAQVGGTQSLNTATHKATFSGLNWTIPANSCKVLTVKASIAAGAIAGDTPKFSIATASDITSTIALDGVFPIESKAMTIAGLSVGWVVVSTSTSPSGTVIAGGTEQAVSSFTVTASSSEGVKLYSLKITEVGTSVDTDISNVKLFYGATQIGSTVSSLTNGAATFDLSSAPLDILAGASKTLTVYVDVGSSVGISGRTIRFEMNNKADITAYGSNSGGTVLAYGGTKAADTWPVRHPNSLTINLGSLVIAQDIAYSPSAQNYVTGSTNNSMVAYKFTAGAYEGVRITYIKLTKASSTLADSDVSNVTLYDIDGNVIAGPTGMVSGLVTFGSYSTGLDASGLFDVEKTKNKTVVVKADVPTGAATNTGVLGFVITTPNSDVKADGLVSQNDLATTDISPSTQLPSTSILHNITQFGSLSVQANPGTPAAATYAANTSNYTFAKFDLVDVGEDILVSQLNITFSTATTPDTTSLATAADVNNIRIYDGGTLLATDPTISSGKAEFGLNLTVPKNTTKTLTVMGDIPSGSVAPRLAAIVGAAADLTLTGASSGRSLTASAAAFPVSGQVMTKGAPALTIRAAGTPVAQTLIKNTSVATVATIYLTASSTEDVRVTSITVAGDSTNDYTGAGDEGLTTMAGNIRLYDGSTQVGNTVPTLTAGANYSYAQFLGLSLNIPKGVTKSIDIKADILNSSSTYYFGIATDTVVAAVGANSGTAATIGFAGADVVVGQAMTFGDAGYLVVQLDLNTPISAQVIEGTSVDMGTWKFTANREDIKISKLVFDVIHSAAATGSSESAANATTTLATTSTLWSFEVSLNDGATTTCTFSTSTVGGYTTGAGIVGGINTNCSNTISATYANSKYQIFATSSGYSVEIRNANANNVAERLLLGLKHGGTETIGTYAGSNNSVASVSLYDGATPVATGYVGADQAGKLVYNFPSGSEVLIPKAAPKTLTLKATFNSYQAAVEGSTLVLRLGTSTATGYYGGNYITAKGASSGSTLATSSILNSSAMATGTLDASAMYIYATKPTVSLNAASPSGSASPGANADVLRFDVYNAPTGFDLNINAIRFSISTNATGTIFGKNFNLYKSTDLNTVIGSGTSFAGIGAADTSSSTTGWVTIYPYASYAVGSGGTATYILKGDTSSMNKTTGNDTLLISIEDGGFYWNDGLAVNANQKVLNLPVAGGTLVY